MEAQQLDFVYRGGDPLFKFGHRWASRAVESEAIHEAASLSKHVGNFGEPLRPRRRWNFNWFATHIRPPSRIHR